MILDIFSRQVVGWMIAERESAELAEQLIAESVARHAVELSSQAAFTVPTEMTDAATSVALVGAAVFSIAVGVKLYKWIKGAL